MAPRYDYLAITALRPNDAVSAGRGYFSMSFPGRWKPVLRRLAQGATGRDVASIPIRSLNAAITALVPDCVVTLKRAGYGDDDEEWLLAYHAVPPDAIFALVTAWVRARTAPPERIAETLRELDACHLSWTPVHVELGSPTGRAIRLLAMDVAASLSKPGAVCPYGDLTFRRCATDDGAELISWPPARPTERTPYSIKITITAHTLPTSDEISAHLDFGVRRWMPIKTSLADHGHSVYLATAVPYLSGVVNSRHFGRASIRTVRTTQDHGTTYLPRWNDDFAKVLDEVGCLARLPDPEQLAADPAALLGSDGDAAALVYSTGMLSKEWVSAGLTALDREALMSWVSAALRPELLQVDPLPRVRAQVYPSVKRDRDVAAQVPLLRAATRAVVGPRLDIELHTDTTAATSLALDALSIRLGTAMPTAAEVDGGPRSVDLDGMIITVRRPVLSIARALDRGSEKRRGPVPTAVQGRVEEIDRALGRASSPTVALVEIGDPEGYRGAQRGDDPIFAVRHGLARTGRLSQFVTPVVAPSRPPRQRGDKPPTDPNRERFAAAIDELFRHLGVRPEELPDPVPNTIAARPALLAVWLIRTNEGKPWGVRRSVPVALLVDPTGREVQLHAPGAEWQPFHTGLLDVGSRFLTGTTNVGKDDVTRFVRSVLDSAVSAYDNTLLLTYAQNLRAGWPNINNRQLLLDSVEFGAERRPINTYPGLRHVRVRTSLGGETPECYGVAEAKPGLPQGLWRYRLPRLYGSTGAKPSSAVSAVVGTSKIVPTEHGDQLRAPRPNNQVWNAQFVELCVAGLQQGDDPDHWAALAHELRWAAPYSKVTTTLPWPLHLAQQVEEYLVPVRLT